MLPTGEQIRLNTAGATATVTTLAASLRALRVGRTALVQEYPEEIPTPWACGIVLVPWPNRVAGARWNLDGAEQLLDVTEPKVGNASHGLLRYTPFAIDSRNERQVTLAAYVFPQHGYPFLLDTSVQYQLEPDGLVVTHTVSNAGGRTAPFAVGTHPFLRVGDVPVGELTVTVEADTCFEVDERMIPTAQVPVGPENDLRRGRRLDEVELDTAYGDLHLDDGVYRHVLAAPDGRTVEMWAEPDFGFVQVFTTDAFPGPNGLERAVAVEPMTAPSNALNTGTGLRWLDPGDTWTASWGIRLR